MIQKDDAVHACAFDTFMRPSPAASSSAPPHALKSWSKRPPSKNHGPDPVRTSSAALTSTAARFSANITAWIIVYHLIATSNSKNIKRWKGRNGMGKGGTNEARKGQRKDPCRRDVAPPLPRRSQPILPSFFFCLRGGVTGRPMFIPP